MTKEQYRQIRLDADMTQADLAAWLGVTCSCVYKRESGDVAVRREAQRAMELLASINAKFIESSKVERIDFR